MAKFNQIQRGGHLPDIIASEIMSQINSGELAPDAKLPPEHDLAESFGVSRNVVREAISRLRSDGVIDTKPGRGAVVLPPSARSSFRIDVLQLAEENRLSSLFELRGLLEINAAGIAAQRRSEQDLERLEAAIALMEGKKGFGDEQLEADADFHRVLGGATSNEYLATIIAYLSNRLKETVRATDKVYAKDDLIEVTVSEHRMILDAVRSGDAAKARAAMAAHIRGAAERLGVEDYDQIHE